MNHLNHPTFSQEYLNLLHKENGMELNQAEHRIQEMGSSSGRIKTPGVGRRGYKQWCQPGVPGYSRVQGSLHSNDRLDFSFSLQIINLFLLCFSLDSTVIDICCFSEERIIDLLETKGSAAPTGVNWREKPNHLGLPGRSRGRNTKFHREKNRNLSKPYQDRGWKNEKYEDSYSQY